MRDHWQYLKYVLRHKWFVFQECWKLGIPFQGIVHDLSKFSPTEWGPYVRSFYNPDGTPRKQRRNPDGSYDPGKQGDDFSRAWSHHQHHNPHHWQYWVLLCDDGTVECLHIPRRFRLEMLADWRGAGRAQGKPDTLAWYRANALKMQLHPDTRAWIEAQLGISADAA